MSAPQHIGIIGCSAEGAALCYRTLCIEAPERLGPYAHPEITMHTPSLALYVDALKAGDLAAVAALIHRSATVLADAGADFLVIPDNTIHQALPDHLPRPLLHIADAVADEAEARGLKRLAILGTRWLMESSVYPTALAKKGIDAVIPGEAARLAIDTAIMDELVLGRIEDGSRTYLTALIGQLAEAGCDGAVLGCTELPLLLGEQAAGIPLLDSTRLLARAALSRATAPKA